MKLLVSTLIPLSILTSCSVSNETDGAMTNQEMIEGKWLLTEVLNASRSDHPAPPDTIAYEVPDFTTILSFSFDDKLIEDDENWGTYMENGKIKFLEGGIYGTSEGPFPDYWDEWPFSYWGSQDTLLARVDDRTFPRILIIQEVTEDYLLLEFEYFWYETWLKYNRID